MQLSEDGQWMWNGTEWVPAQNPPPQVIQSNPGVMFSPVVPMPIEETGRKVVPWIGVGLIFFSLLLPYISIFGFSVSGLDMLGFIGEAAEASGDIGDDGSGGGGGDADLEFGETMFLVAAALMVFSPIVYILSAIIGAVLISTKTSPKILAIVHIGYFVLFILTATLGSVDLLGEDLSILGFVGFGFYLGSLSPGLWFVDK